MREVKENYHILLNCEVGMKVWSL
jgi:hypothetical protein